MGRQFLLMMPRLAPRRGGTFLYCPLSTVGHPCARMRTDKQYRRHWNRKHGQVWVLWPG